MPFLVHHYHYGLTHLLPGFQKPLLCFVLKKSTSEKSAEKNMRKKSTALSKGFSVGSSRSPTSQAPRVAGERYGERLFLVKQRSKRYVSFVPP